jgi:hypothetical protein
MVDTLPQDMVDTLPQDMVYTLPQDMVYTLPQDMVYIFSLEEVSHALERCLRERAKTMIYRRLSPEFLHDL